MKILRPDTDLDKFFTSLAESGQCTLLLDYDGTLAPFRIKPEEAAPYPEVRRLLDGIMLDKRTRVVLVSGRWTRDLLPITGLKQMPEIWGSHGWERLYPDGHYETSKPDETALHGLAEADAWIEEILTLGGRAEQKPAGLAIHWRGLAPQQIAQIRDLLLDNWALLAQETGLDLHEFDGGMELRVPGRHKGHAVETVLAEMPPDSVAAYLGDDLTDEDAFNAIRGRGLGVLVRDEPRPSNADVWLQPPNELTEFLARWRQCRVPQEARA